LSDEDQDVEGFLERFDEVISLANDGAGVLPKEAMQVLRNCLKGRHRRLAFANVIKEAKETGTLEKEPAKVLQTLRDELIRFSWSKIEKQHAAMRKFDVLERNKRTALDWEQVWQAAVNALKDVGLKRTPEDLLISYLTKTPTSLRLRIMNDKRLYPKDPQPGAHRGPLAWEEAHTIAIELDSLQVGARALDYAGTQRTVYAAEVSKACYEWMRAGKCKHGDQCKFEHDESLKGTQTKNNGPKGKGKGKGKGKPKRAQSAQPSSNGI